MCYKLKVLKRGESLLSTNENASFVSFFFTGEFDQLLSPYNLSNSLLAFNLDWFFENFKGFKFCGDKTTFLSTTYFY